VSIVCCCAEQTSNLLVVLKSNDQDHADGNVECRTTHASREAVGSERNGICLNVHAPNGVAEVAIHSQIASQRSEVANGHNVDMVMYG
jgi:hypothetical protein